MWKRPNLDLPVTWKETFSPARGASVACGIFGNESIWLSLVSFWPATSICVNEA